MTPQWQYVAQAADCTVVQFVPAKNREEVAQMLRALQTTELDVACSSQPTEICTEQLTWQHDAVHSGTKYRHLWKFLPPCSGTKWRQKFLLNISTPLGESNRTRRQPASQQTDKCLYKFSHEHCVMVSQTKFVVCLQTESSFQFSFKKDTFGKRGGWLWTSKKAFGASTSMAEWNLRSSGILRSVWC